jgi:hypothetical protein
MADGTLHLEPVIPVAQRVCAQLAAQTRTARARMRRDGDTAIDAAADFRQANLAHFGASRRNGCDRDFTAFFFSQLLSREAPRACQRSETFSRPLLPPVRDRPIRFNSRITGRLLGWVARVRNRPHPPTTPFAAATHTCRMHDCATSGRWHDLLTWVRVLVAAVLPRCPEDAPVVCAPSSAPLA